MATKPKFYLLDGADIIPMSGLNCEFYGGVVQGPPVLASRLAWHMPEPPYLLYASPRASSFLPFCSLSLHYFLGFLFIRPISIHLCVIDAYVLFGAA